MQIEGDRIIPLAVSPERGLELIMERCAQDSKAFREEDTVEGKEQISATTLNILFLTFLERERPCNFLRTMR
jgi:hypothetical protein